MAWAKAKRAAAMVAASLFTVGTTLIAQSLIPHANHSTLDPETFVTASGAYQWTNASVVRQVTFLNNKLRTITLGTSHPPAAGAIIVEQMTNAPSQSKLTIRNSEVRFVTSDGLHQSSVGITTWHPGQNWFVYRDKGMRVWACDGDRGLWMLTATPLGSDSFSIERLEEQPPPAVLRRLPEGVRKMLPAS